MVVVETSQCVVACEHHPGGIVERDTPAEDSTAEEHSLRRQGSFEVCNDLFLFGEAAWQAVEHVVKTNTFKGVAYCGKGQEKIVPDTVRFKPLEPAPGPGKAAGAVVEQGQFPLFRWSLTGWVLQGVASMGEVACSASCFKVGAADIPLVVFFQIERRTSPDKGIPHAVNPCVIKKENGRTVGTDRPVDFFFPLWGVHIILSCFL